MSRTTLQDLVLERNSLRIKLWADDVFAHRWLCHPDGEPCSDGCNAAVKGSRKAFYESDIEN